mmetsp:Transcript_29310/g.32440  ORF Transcript_29310/g.32440 Transcript_29310/m.32440 type:complete len:148 (-) Transcript_29310:219-662(-)
MTTTQPQTKMKIGYNRSICFIILFHFMLSLNTVAAFHHYAIGPQNNNSIRKMMTNSHNNNKEFVTFAVNTKKSSLRMSSSKEEKTKAVKDFKMINEEESALRKVGGLMIGIATGILQIKVFPALDYSSLCAGLFASIATYRTGSQYQ